MFHAEGSNIYNIYMYIYSNISPISICYDRVSLALFALKQLTSERDSIGGNEWISEIYIWYAQDTLVVQAQCYVI